MNDQNDIQPKDTCHCSPEMGRGCRFCNCGSETMATPCEGCYKLHTTDWLEDYPENYENNILEVRFKNTRRGYYVNASGVDLKQGDIVAVEASPGHDIGIVSLSGDIVARQMKRVGFNPQNGEYKKIYRKAKPYDIEKWQEAIAMEHETMIRSRQIAASLGLNMKIGDVEYQGDKIKAIFYYIADERVDFRELIKIFAEQFHIRVEMKQIGARQEAGRIGGLGSCGRELCCASWISGFISVTTNAARHQELSLNPLKLAGQCGKLKCCLIYELDTYLDARKDFPRLHGPLQVMDADYFHVKSDILSKTMSFSTAPNSLDGAKTISVARVKEIMEANRKGSKPDRLEDASSFAPVSDEPSFVSAGGEDSITRFDRQGGNRNNNRRKKGGNREANPQHEGQQRGQQGGDRSHSDRKPHGDRQGGNRPQGEHRQQQGQQSGEPRQGGNSQQGGQGGNRPQGQRRDNRYRGRGNSNRGGGNSGNDGGNSGGGGNSGNSGNPGGQSGGQ